MSPSVYFPVHSFDKTHHMVQNGIAYQTTNYMYFTRQRETSKHMILTVSIPINAIGKRSLKWRGGGEIRFSFSFFFIFIVITKDQVFKRIHTHKLWTEKVNLHVHVLIIAFVDFRFMVTSFYTKYDGIHFVFNSLSLLGLSLVPKFPQMYKVRLFGLNKY